MINYLINTESLFDFLAIVGFPILNIDFVEYIVDGLGHSTNPPPLPYIFYHPQLYDLLICDVHFQKKPSSISPPIVAMVVTRSPQSLSLSKSSSKCKLYGHNNHGRSHGNGGQYTPR